MSNIVPLSAYEVHEFAWGSAIKHRAGEWEKLFLKPDAQEVDVTDLLVVLHENGIEIVGVK